jgi:hypothetical protein
MPSLMFTQSIAAGAIFDPLDTWNYQYVPRPGIVKLNHNATAVGLLATWTSGSDQLMQEAPVPAGGTAGQIPSDFNVPPMIDQVGPGDRQSIRYRNPTGGAITVNGIIDYTATR